MMPPIPRSSKSGLGIYIPTLNRIGKQHTLRRLQTVVENGMYPVYLVCPPEEVGQHVGLPVGTKVLACDAKGIGNVRQWVLENGREDIIVMADDDMIFNRRNVADQPATTMPTMKPEEMGQIFDTIKKWVLRDGQIHGGMGPRSGNNRIEGKKGRVLDGVFFTECGRVNNFHYVNRKEINKLGVRWDELEVMEDFHFTLTLLTKGIPNRIIHSWMWNQGASGAPGGCSTYRTGEVQKKSAEELQKRFPGLVRLVEKESRSSWDGMKTRTDVVISWKKAYDQGLETKKSRSV